MQSILKYLISLVLLLPLGIQAQQAKGKVVRAESFVEIEGVEILDASGNKVAETDALGNFELGEFGSYTFRKLGFQIRAGVSIDKAYAILELQEKPEDLNEVVIKTGHYQNRLRKIPSSIDVITQSRIQSTEMVNIAPVINSTPGVYMHNGTLTTNRITIRGIGSRNPFGTSKIRAYYQDIPLTNGSGQTTLEDMELTGLTRMEILKGPSSSLYGAGLGGTIQMIPDKGFFDTTSLGAGILIGSFGLQKYQADVKLGNSANAAAIRYTDTRREGYRDNNETDRKTLTLASNHYLDARNNLVLIGNFIDLKAYIPSSLDEEDYLNNPESAAFTWDRARGFEDYKRGLLGVSWNHKYRNGSKQVTSVFGSFFDSYEARPFNILEENTLATGVRSRYVSRTSAWENELEWTAGIEFFLDRNDFQTFENLYQDFSPGTGSVKGEPLSDLTEVRYYFNLFVDGKYSLSPRTSLDLGFNLNRTDYRLNDNFGTGLTDLSGDYSFQTMFSPKLGLTWQMNASNSFYGTVSHGFSPPTLEETLLPDGLINTDIQPETGWNYEIGSRGTLLKGTIRYTLSAYYMDVQNLLVARRTSEDEFIGINAGKVGLLGMEFSLDYYLVRTEAVTLGHRSAISWNDHKFKEFEDGERDYSGNELPGVPDFSCHSQLYLDSRPGWYGYLTYYAAGRMPITDDNSVFSDAYQLVHLKVGYARDLGSRWRLDLSAGVNNLFDEKYASMLQINAGSFGNNAPRYYYPGEPVNFFSGCTFSYSF